MKSRTHRQTLALVQLLEALPDDQLAAVLEGLGVVQADREAATTRRNNWKYCATCGLVYPRCRAAYAADHEFVWAQPRTRTNQDDDGAEALREALEPGRSTT